MTVRLGAGPVKTIPIPLPAGSPRKSEQHTIAIGDGKQVVHVRVSTNGQTWEAIVSGGANDPIWSGLTGYTRGDEGERSGDVVFFNERDAATKFVLVGEIREDTRICGQDTTPLAVRGLDPKTMQLRGATLHRIAQKERDAATPITAKPTLSPSSPPIARLLHATGGSSAGVAALTDNEPATAWSEDRPGDGHGEFATMSAPPEVPLRSLLVTSAAKGAAPRTFFIATDKTLFHVTMPENGALKPGTKWEVPFPEPVRTSCVAVVLDEAYGEAAAPVVSLAEVEGRSAFEAEGATSDDLVDALAGPRADEAAAILRRSGDVGLAAVERHWPKLDAKARAFAIDIASSAGTCTGSAMNLLARALADADREVKKRAVGRVERCAKAAAPALIELVKTSHDEAQLAHAATMLGSLAPSQAFDPIATRLGTGSAETRHSLRAALTKAAAVTPSDKLAAAVSAGNLEVLRALGAKLADPAVKPAAEAKLASLLEGSPDLATRYLALEPMAQLGQEAKLAAIAKSDPEWPVRAHALEVGAQAPEAVHDPEPRVREAALRATGADASNALAHDPWTFVRIAAAEALGKSGKDNAALAKALGDRSPRVRGAVLVALGKANARDQGAKVYARLDDTKEDTEVRALAARTLGALCVQSAADRLTKLALLAQHPVDEADERLGMAALEGLGQLHPPDLEKRLAPLREKTNRTLLRRAADAALATAPTCAGR